MPIAEFFLFVLNMVKGIFFFLHQVHKGSIFFFLSVEAGGDFFFFPFGGKLMWNFFFLIIFEGEFFLILCSRG